MRRKNYRWLRRRKALQRLQSSQGEIWVAGNPVNEFVSYVVFFVGGICGNQISQIVTSNDH
jgi:hypothetical protein